MSAGNDGKKEKAGKAFPFPSCPTRSLFLSPQPTKKASAEERVHSGCGMLTVMRPKFDAGGSGGSLPNTGFLTLRVRHCLVPVRRFLSPSRSIRFGDVSEANGRETPSHFHMDHVIRNALAARKNEA